MRAAEQRELAGQPHDSERRLVTDSQRLARESTVEGAHRVLSEIASRHLPGVVVAFVRTGLDGRPVVLAGYLDGQQATAAIEGWGARLSAIERYGPDGCTLTEDGVLGLPLFEDSSLVAVLCLSRSQTPLCPDDALCVSHLLPQITICLRNAALFDNLERMIAHEMTRVVESEASIQLVLDSMAEGLLVCNLNGLVGSIRSKVVERWLGPVADSASLWSYLFPKDQIAADQFRLAYQQMTEDVLPFELAAEQVPSLVRREDRSYRLGFRPVQKEGVFSDIVITIKDISLDIERERLDRVMRELPAIIGHVLCDRDGFLTFVEEAENLMGTVDRPPTRVEQARALHTLKGSSAVLGLCHFAHLCNDLEERMAADPDEPTTDSLAQLRADWRQALEPLRAFLARNDDGSVRITGSEYNHLLTQLEADVDRAQILTAARSWTNASMATLLGMLAGAGGRVADRLGKKIEVRIDDGIGRLPDDRLRPFLTSLVHVVRNAVDHGIESPEVRVAHGKPPTGLLVIRSVHDSGGMLVAVADDGAGIDWDEIARRGAALGLPVDDVVPLLFVDGLGTRSHTSDISGRGVGLAATRALCEQIGGRVEVDSRRGAGTEFRFWIPLGQRPPA